MNVARDRATFTTGTERDGAGVRDQLEKLVQQMLDRGIRYEDARREFERCFIARALARSGGSVCRAADLLGVHRNSLARKISEYRLPRKV